LKTFQLSNRVVSEVLKEIDQAKVFIKIAVFQVHLIDLFTILEKKISSGIQVEIFTLPLDSIHEPVSEEVSNRLNKLKVLGANLHFCKWNVGDPERTTTAVGRWYSFHGKFIVTEQAAIALSANFTQNNELDACLIIKNEKELVSNFSKKFEELVNLFVNPNNGYDGSIREKILNVKLNNVENVFELPRIIETTIHKNNWVKQYPSALCPDEIIIEDKLYIAPFDIKGRQIYKEIINEAKKFVYISAESFTDSDFGLFLRKSKTSNKITVKLLSGFTSMDFSDRIQKMYRELLADDIQIFTFDDNLHAKLLITDKHLLIGSINLNKMNLGFSQTKNYWRSNTETFFVTSDKGLISDAKKKFENQLKIASPMEVKLAKKIEKETSNIINKMFNIRTSSEVKKLFSRFILLKEIKLKKDSNKLIVITKKLMEHFIIKIANKDVFFMAIILYYLQDRKHSYLEIKDKLDRIDSVNNLKDLLLKLSDSKFIKQESEFFKIDIETLF
jgi:hypothetical protein